MASKILNTRMQLKYDMEANWTAKNPVLLSGEMAISSDKSGQFKTGNGTSTWSQLSYNQIPWASVTGRPSAMKNPTALTVQFNGTTNRTYDGSSAQTVNITPAVIGAAAAVHTHSYLPLSGGTVTGTIAAHTFSGTLNGNASTAVKLQTPRTISISNGAAGTATSFDGSSNISIPITNIDPGSIGSGSTKKSFYLNTHPENAPVVIPFINNDMAFLLKRGGSTKIYYDNVLTAQDISNVFDGSPSYWAINPTGTTEIAIELTLHKVFTWTNILYVDFGSASWRAKTIYIDVMNTNNNETSWTNKGTLNNNSSGNYYITISHNSGTGFNKVRFRFQNWNNATNFRIACLGLVNNGSTGLRETFIPKDGGSLFGNLYPNSNNTNSIGTSSNKWNAMYASTFNGALNGNASSSTKLATARKIGTASFDGTKDIPLKEYTVNIPKASWSTAYPFKATISVSGILAEKNYILCKDDCKTKSEADLKQYEKNISYIFSADPANGSVIFYAKKKPTIDFTTVLKEVL